jgi:beta-glucosidase
MTKEEMMKYNQEAEDIVKQMTLDEKIYLMAGVESPRESMGGGGYNAHPYKNGDCQRLKVPAFAFCDGPRGVVTGHSTCFPVSMGCGATFDRELENRIGHAIGEEIRAYGGNFFGGVCMNIPYNPAAGRSQECFGEDSYHMGEMALALMQGVQGENVVACLKHYAFNSMERARFKVNVTADKRTEREVFFPHFKKCIDNGAGSVMAAYNSYQGVHCGHSSYLLRDVLKGEWDFKGFVISDFVFCVRSALGGITGGLDVEMHFRWKYKPKKIKSLLKKGKITQAMIDESALRIVRTMLAFTKQKDSKAYSLDLVADKEHVALAKEAALKSITLIKNEGGFLPLDVKDEIVLVGDLADVENIGDHGSSRVHPPYVKTLKGALEKEYPEVRFVFVPTKEVEKQSQAIEKAKAAVLVCGMKHGDEGEFVFTYGGDRKNLELHKDELDMIDKVYQLNQNIMVALIGGNVILTHCWQDKAKAILFAYYPGMEGGSALADLIFGKACPSGKLPFAIAQRADEYPEVNFKAREQHYGYYHGYQKIDKDGNPYDYPYGFGLSYTSFERTKPILLSLDEEKATFQLEVANTGKMEGGETVQLYVGFNNSVVDRPDRVLRDFQKIYLKPGERKSVVLSVKKPDLAWFNEKTNAFEEEDIEYTAFIGTDEQEAIKEAINFRFKK